MPKAGVQFRVTGDDPELCDLVCKLRVASSTVPIMVQQRPVVDLTNLLQATQLLTVLVTLAHVPTKEGDLGTALTLNLRRV
eukprot:1129829-Prymnesium_polylepis.2